MTPKGIRSVPHHAVGGGVVEEIFGNRNHFGFGSHGQVIASLEFGDIMSHAISRGLLRIFNACSNVCRLQAGSFQPVSFRAISLESNPGCECRPEASHGGAESIFETSVRISSDVIRR